MLSERKKYNYNIGTSQSGIPTSRSRQTSSSISSSAYKSSVLPLYQNENINLQYVEDLGGSQSKRILELQAANKKMLEETTKQFQKFQADVVKVQGILRIKEQQVERLQQETKELTEDKAALIQALKEKQAIIVQFHAKLRQLIQERQSRRKESTPTSTQTSCPPPATQSTTQTSTPTGPSTEQYTQLQTELQTYIQKYQTERTKNEQLTQQVYKLKQQVYEVSSELGLVKQQFDTYKLLQEIQEVRKS